ncbi:phage tail tip lysozyme [Microbacterium sp. NPDC076895]|uniref:phage tail tip lysozyme n=1 Tax=Microbacterium sp. NPDC076895 TaxID=3154957 RepID=UPI0034476E7F
MRALTLRRRAVGIFAALIAVLLNVAIPNAAFAVFDERFYSSNEILFYDPRAVACSARGASSAATVEALRGDDNASKIYNFWTDAGLTAQQAAGIAGSIQHESGFSPFRQEMPHADGKPVWPDGGWGIAQFTWDPGQRGDATAYVRNDIGADLFDKYYKNDYGGSVFASNGYVPDGVPTEVNDKFLLSELNYLLDHIKGLNPNNIRRGDYQRDFDKSFGTDTTLYDYLATLSTASDVAIAWTYLYEYPGDIKATATARGESAEALLATLGTNVTSSCGGSGPTDGGMTLDQAKAFMQTYLQIDDGDPNNDAQYLSGACYLLTDNCVTFSSYFVRKYTTLNWQGADGGKVVNALSEVNPDAEVGTVPQTYAIFGTRKGSTICDDGLPCGHTGIVLGVDTARNKVIVGEAAYCNPSFTAAREYDLDAWSNGEYTYLYAKNNLNPDRSGDLY